MAQLTKAAFDTKYVDPAGTFAVNNTRQIEEEDFQEFSEDTKDSAMFMNDNLLDEDDFASDSATAAPTQQSTAAYVASQIAAAAGIVPDSGSEPALKYKVVSIGDWDMTVVPPGTKTVAHGLSDHKKIRSVSVIVRDDADTNYYDLVQMESSTGGAIAGAVKLIDSTNITLQIEGSGTFDDAAFNATSYNRGWITIIFVA